MKTIDLTGGSPSLPELLRLASENNVILRAADGKEFLLAELDELALETLLIRQQPELMALLDQRSHGEQTRGVDEVRRSLGLK